MCDNGRNDRKRHGLPLSADKDSITAPTSPTILRCESITPFGRPVVPEVYTSVASSPAWFGLGCSATPFLGSHFFTLTALASVLGASFRHTTRSMVLACVRRAAHAGQRRPSVAAWPQLMSVHAVPSNQR